MAGPCCDFVYAEPPCSSASEFNWSHYDRVCRRAVTCLSSGNDEQDVMPFHHTATCARTNPNLWAHPLSAPLVPSPLEHRPRGMPFSMVAPSALDRPTAFFFVDALISGREMSKSATATSARSSPTPPSSDLVRGGRGAVILPPRFWTLELGPNGRLRAMTSWPVHARNQKVGPDIYLIGDHRRLVNWPPKRRSDGHSIGSVRVPLPQGTLG